MVKSSDPFIVRMKRRELQTADRFILGDCFPEVSGLAVTPETKAKRLPCNDVPYAE